MKNKVFYVKNISIMTTLEIKMIKERLRNLNLEKPIKRF